MRRRHKSLPVQLEPTKPLTSTIRIKSLSFGNLDVEIRNKRLKSFGNR